MQGDKLGQLLCPCCGGAWMANEQKGGGVTLKCAKGFQGWAKNPACNTGIRAALAGGPAPAPASSSSGRKRGSFAEFIGERD